MSLPNRLFFCLLVLCCCSGCATARQWIPNISSVAQGCPSDKACIYVMRPALIGSAIHFVVYDNNKGVGETGPRSYLAWQREPGEVTLVSQAENNARISFTAEEGQIYYVLQSVEIGFMTSRNSLKLISEDQALKYLKACHLAVGK